MKTSSSVLGGQQCAGATSRAVGGHALIAMPQPRILIGYYCSSRDSACWSQGTVERNQASSKMAVKSEGPVSSGDNSALEGAEVMSVTSNRVFVPCLLLSSWGLRSGCSNDSGSFTHVNLTLEAAVTGWRTEASKRVKQA